MKRLHKFPTGLTPAAAFNPDYARIGYSCLVGIWTLSIVIAAAAAGCSFFGGSSDSSLELLPVPAAAVRAANSAALSESELAYCRSGATDVCFAVFRQCDLSPRVGGLATTRQFFIGLRDLSIVSQEQQQVLGFALLRTEANARLDHTALHLTIYTQRRSRCSIDLAAWAPSAAPRTAGGLREFEAEAQPVFAAVFAAPAVSADDDPSSHQPRLEESAPPL